MIHGGLADDMNAHRFWNAPGISGELDARGWRVLAPDRETTPASWEAAARDAAELVSSASTVVAGSNGVSVALRLAIDFPELVTRLVLLWPATAGDPDVDAEVPPAAAHLLAGETVRGVDDRELADMRQSVAVMASNPPNRFHQRRTVDRLTQVIPKAVRIDTAFPESPQPDFMDHLGRFIDTLEPHLGGP